MSHSLSSGGEASEEKTFRAAAGICATRPVPICSLNSVMLNKFSLLAKGIPRSALVPELAKPAMCVKSLFAPRVIREWIPG